MPIDNLENKLLNYLYPIEDIENDLIKKISEMPFDIFIKGEESWANYVSEFLTERKKPYYGLYENFGYYKKNNIIIKEKRLEYIMKICRYPLIDLCWKFL